MTDIEHRLREAMHEAVDDAQTRADLVAAVMRRHRRYLARVVGLAAVGAIAVATVPFAVAWRGTAHGPLRPGVSVPASSPTPARPSRGPSPRRSAAPAREPAWMRGLPLPATTDLRLLVDGRDPTWFSTVSGGMTPITGLPRSRFPYVLTRLSGGWAAEPSPKGPACEPQCPGPELPVYYIADGSAMAHRIGSNTEAAIMPGSEPGTLWLSRYPKGTTDTTTAAVTAQEIAQSGRALGSPGRLPAGYGIEAQVRGYLLLTPNSQGPGPVLDELWDPSTRRVIRTFAGVVAASANQVAWGLCGGCAVHVLDLRTGSTATIGVPARTWAFDGMFSADDRFLAVHLSGGVRPDGWATLDRLAVIDLQTGQLRLLAGSAVGTDRTAGLTFGWQGSSDTLVAAVTGHVVEQIGIWHPAARLLVRRIWLPPGMTFAVGPFG